MSEASKALLHPHNSDNPYISHTLREMESFELTESPKSSAMNSNYKLSVNPVVSVVLLQIEGSEL